MRNLRSKKGSSQVNVMIGVVVLLILVSALAPTALVGLFNTTAFQCIGISNATGCFTSGGIAQSQTGVPTWVVTALGSLGAIAFIYLIWRASQ